MTSRLQNGNLGLSADENDQFRYIVGYANAILEVEKQNRFVTIRSVKYSTHKKSEEIRDVADPDDETRITILLGGGPWKQDMWLKLDKSDLKEFRLEKPGDYLIWEPGYYHNWQPLGYSTMLTVSLWRPKLAICTND